ncbi:MAG: ABC transporter permease [Eubacteriaceae bacterium]|nr:ABC transporter permease [Eubacteriaceae bacterium]
MSFNFTSFLNSCPGALAQGILWGIMATGVFITFVILDYADLTVDNSFCTGGAVCAMLILGGMSPAVSLIFAFLSGTLAGMITALLHTKLKIPGILSGILTQLALYSINMRIMQRANVSLLKAETVISLKNIPHSIVIGAGFMVVLIAILYWFFGTEIGSGIRATGNNSRMAEALGINTDTMKIIALMMSNGLVALSGGLVAQYQGYADINMGRGAIVIGLASVIIGEVIFGKNINFAIRVLSTFIGCVIYYLIITLVLQAGLNTSDLKLFSAIVVAVALAIPALKKGKVKGGDR